MDAVMQPSVTFPLASLFIPSGNGEGSAADATGLGTMDPAREDMMSHRASAGAGEGEAILWQRSRLVPVLCFQQNGTSLACLWLTSAQRGRAASPAIELLASLAEGHEWQRPPPPTKGGFGDQTAGLTEARGDREVASEALLSPAPWAPTCEAD